MLPRVGSDRCPGVLRPFVAEDGALVRLRVPGGRIRISSLTALVDAATDLGAPVVQLTSRAALQIRALPDPVPDTLVGLVGELGLLPSASRERMRNLLAAPLAVANDGPDGSGVAGVVAELDAALQDAPDLDPLPGRFLFAVTDATGSILSEPWDVAYRADSPDSGDVLVAGHALRVSRRDAVPEILARARAFLRHRTGPETWNVRELPDPQVVTSGMRPHRVEAPAPTPPGPIGQDLVAGVPLGMLTAGHVAALAAVAEHVVVTRWRSLVVPGGAGAAPALGDAGLAVSPDSPRARLSARQRTWRPCSAGRGLGFTSWDARDAVAGPGEST
jgi:precorrin-3B synthase